MGIGILGALEVAQPIERRPTDPPTQHVSATTDDHLGEAVAAVASSTLRGMMAGRCMPGLCTREGLVASTDLGHPRTLAVKTKRRRWVDRAGQGAVEHQPLARSIPVRIG